MMRRTEATPSAWRARIARISRSALLLIAALVAGCSGGEGETLPQTAAVPSSTTEPSAPSTAAESPDSATQTGSTDGHSSSGPATTEPPPSPPTSGRTEELPDFFTTLQPETTLPSEQACAERILSTPSEEVRPENAGANSTVVAVAVVVDGAGEAWNDRNASRVTGDFVGTTDQILRWASCKWGFDEDITRARAVTESSWRVGTEGDVTDDADACALIGLDVPCPQSYGLLQVKGTVHEGTYPASTSSSAFGVDYAMAWLRACFEGEFTWFESPDYAPGDEWGCVGAWFSGLWWNESATRYVGEVRFHLAERSWTSYS